MKSKIVVLMMAVAALFLVYGCEDDLLDITEEFEYETEMVVFSNDMTYTISQNIDLADSVDLINEYGDKIKDIEIVEVKYWLTAHQGSEEQLITEATLKVADQGLTNQKTIATIEDQLLHVLVGNQTNLDVNQEGIDKLADLIENPPHKFNLTFTSAANEAPLDFTIKFWFKIKMTANPLN